MATRDGGGNPAVRNLALWTLVALAACSGTAPVRDANADDDGKTAGPRVYWKRNPHGGETRLAAAGSLATTANLGSALESVARHRDDSASRSSVFLVLRHSDGWRTLEFSRDPIGDIRLDEIATHELPLASDPTNPLTYVIDSAGVVGTLIFKDHRYSLRGVTLDLSGVLVPAGDHDEVFSLDRVRALPNIQEPPRPQPAVDGFIVPRELVNHAQTVRWTPQFSFRPDASIDTLANGMKWMSTHLARDVAFRAAGSRHSWSPIARSTGVTILPESCRGVESLQSGESPLAPDAQAALYRVLAGTRIRELNAALQQRGRAIPYLGGFDGQTIGGVLPTGTHGSVLRLGPLADLVRSIDLVCFDGQTVRIEPARAPVTDPRFLQSAHPSMTLRVDDDLFDAARIGLGSFGVIHSLILETVPKYWLKEVRTVTTASDAAGRLSHGGIYEAFEPKDAVLAKLRDPSIQDVGEAPDAASQWTGFPGHPRRAFHFELLWNPYSDKVLVTTRHWIDEQTRRQFDAHEPEVFENPPTRSFLRIVGLTSLTDTYSRPALTELLAEYTGSTSIAFVEAIEKLDPKSVPMLIDAAIDGLKDPNGYVQRSYNVFNIGRAANLLPSISATISVPLRDDLWLRAVDIIRQTSAHALDSDVVLTGPISLRFVAGSRALLADPEDVCKFEIIFGGTDDLTQRNADTLVRKMYQDLRSALGADVRLHFGQLIPTGTLDARSASGELPIEVSFPRYGAWRRHRDQLDPEGRGLTPWLNEILPAAR